MQRAYSTEQLSFKACPNVDRYVGSIVVDSTLLLHTIATKYRVASLWLGPVVVLEESRISAML